MLTLTTEGIQQKINTYEKFWSFKALFEQHEPLDFEPLDVRREAMLNVLPLAEAAYATLSEAGRRCYDFWKLLRPERIPTRRFKYTTKVVDTYEWNLTLSPKGLLYTDKSREYCTSELAYRQLLSDFWFYGPRMPIPDLSIRQALVEAIRSAFSTEAPLASSHFPLFEYPLAKTKLGWTTGGSAVQDFVHVRNYGIDIGQSNWHDGLVFLDFVSFELFLTGQAKDLRIKPKVKAAIQEHLQKALQPKG